MKLTLENTLDNKSKFFALYWGQSFLNGINGTSILSLIDINDISLGRISGKLLLKPLSQISDEDAEYCIGKIECSMRKNDPNNADFGMSPSSIFVNSLKGHNSFYIGRHEADYLRSKGYALKWINVSVETLVEWGWIKLKEVK